MNKDNNIPCNIKVLLGATIVEISNHKNEELYFKTDDGTKYKMYHCKDCCESVSIESIVGDLEDLIGSPITVAEESCSKGSEKDNTPNRRIQFAESTTWTFYKLATIKGYVTIRWVGDSNGYYSEGVDFEQIVD
jgi:(p)ppGpp synthase/HD superfamily hydrolase